MEIGFDLASYNWGERSVRRAIERNRKARKNKLFKFKDAARDRNYVPKLLAMREIINNPSRYGIQFR